MGRRIAYAATLIPVALILALAVFWVEVRFALVSLGLAIAAGGWWLAHRFESRPSGSRELAMWGLLVLGVAIAAAVLLPDTRIPCDCPQPRGVVRASCHCDRVEHHLGSRVVIAGLGATASAAMLTASRRRRSRPKTRRAASA